MFRATGPQPAARSGPKALGAQIFTVGISKLQDEYPTRLTHTGPKPTCNLSGFKQCLKSKDFVLGPNEAKAQQFFASKRFLALGQRTCTILDNEHITI